MNNVINITILLITLFLYVPKQNPVISEIGNLYKRNTFNTLLYGFMAGVQWTVPSLTKREAAEMFLKRFAIADNMYDVECAVTTYNRMHQDAIDAQKT